MALLSRLLGRSGWSLEGISLPWRTGEISIYDHVRAHLVPGQPGLAAGGESLPDEERLAAAGGLRWVAGALDGTFAQHGGAGVDEAVAERLHEALMALGERATSKALGDLYDLMLRHSALESVDALNGRIVRGGIDPTKLHTIARFLATRAPDREPVKMAIAWLGLLRGGDDDELLRSLARHEEFTLYAAVALANRLEDPERTLFSLARQVDGWGRIHLVERLADTENPEIRRWLVREGFRNTVANAYTVLIAARTGRLSKELERGDPDSPLFVAAGEILSGLIRGQGGPSGGIDDYEEGAAATARYLDLLVERAERLEDLNHAATIREFLVDDGEDAWADREIHGWTPELRARLIAQCDEVLAWPAWREKIAQVVSGDGESDRAAFAVADEAARALGIDLWDAHFRRAEVDLDAWHWQAIAATKEPGRRQRVLALAEARLDLARIGSGPALDFGFGPAFKEASCLEATLPALLEAPGEGVGLVLAALAGQAIRLRHRALDVIAAWGPDARPEPVAAALARAAAAEPDDEVRSRIEALLADPEPAN
ncbi:MAG TPA: hypothetical protein VGS22_29545 [Thermoanaerobaculia bacterium]|jgi:hypothetical protein|nr:hypothetical protein [Thermoanaerobaculia bacterium]